MRAFGVISKDYEVRLNSSSGGFFTELCKKIIDNGGVVYGVSMSDDCYNAVFLRINTIGDLKKIRGSKYLQAQIGDTFKEVKKDLENGVKVLFSGTGCQINGLLSYLGDRNSNLVLVDVICHGVPSPKVWNIYLKDQELKLGKVKSVNFRYKKNGWKDFAIKENEVYISKDEDNYMQIFLKNLSLRPSCYNCSAKSIKMSDFTIADFWGCENFTSEFNDGLGISLIILRTEKAENLFAKIKDNIVGLEVPYEQAISFNPAEYRSVAKPYNRDIFFSDLQKMDFNSIVKKYVKGPLWKQLARKARNYFRSRGGNDYGMFFEHEKRL